MRPISIEQFNARSEKAKDLNAFAISGFHSYEFYAWWHKQQTLVVALAFPVIILTSYLSSMLMSLYPVSALVTIWLELFPIFQPRYDTLLSYSPYSAHQFAIGTILGTSVGIVALVYYIIGYFRYWEQFGEFKRVNHNTFACSVLMFLLAAYVSYQLYVALPPDQNPSRYSKATIFVGPLFPIFSWVFAAAFVYFFAQPVVFLIKLAIQLTHGRSKERP